MKNKDKLIAIINKISKRENKHPEIVVSELNNMSEEELNKKLRTMDIFKDGGKIDYLLCLKKGGKTKKCGCGNKVEKAQRGRTIFPEGLQTIMHAPVVKINDGDTTATMLLEDPYPTDADRIFKVRADKNGRTATLYNKISMDGNVIPFQTYKTNPTWLQRMFGIKPLTDKQNAEIDSVIKKQDGGNLAQVIPSNWTRQYNDVDMSKYKPVVREEITEEDVPFNWTRQAPTVDMSKYEPAIEEEVIEENIPAFVPTNRRQAKAMAKHNGLSNAQFRTAWRNAKYAQNNYGDPNASARDNIRAAAMSFAKPAAPAPAPAAPVATFSATMFPTVTAPAVRSNQTGVAADEYRAAIRDFNQGSFGDAFAQSRAAGKQTFNWRGKEYTTQLAKPASTASQIMKDTAEQNVEIMDKMTSSPKFWDKIKGAIVGGSVVAPMK